jgi:branched-chain amino acid transport system ATP-binding protein
LLAGNRHEVANSRESNVCAAATVPDALADRALRASMPPDPSASPLLRVSDVAMRFGGVVALGGVSFDVGYGQICGLIGPNGSGKTTLFNCISGFYRYADGDILFEGRSLKNLGRHRMAGLGLGRTFQNVALFRNMSVRDNILVGAHHLGRSGFITNALRLPVVRREDAQATGRLHDLLDLLALNDVADSVAGGLPFGTRKRVELARALIGRPKLLLLDEPAGGLNHGEVDDLARLLQQIRTHFDLSILLVEHHMNLVMRVSDKVVALEFGLKIADGTPDEVRSEPEVIRAYLGETQDMPHAHVA